MFNSFSPASHSLIIDSISLEELFQQRYLRTITSHPFNQHVQLILPTKVHIEIPILNQLLSNIWNEKNGYFLVKNVPIHLFVHQIFIQMYVSKGNLTALSINTKVTLDNCMCISSGLLTLSLDENTYHQLGILGRKSILQRKKKIIQKYIVEINLLSPLCSQDTKYYQRVFRVLRNINIRFDILLKWLPDNEKLSSSSITKFFEYVSANPGNEGGYILGTSNIIIEKCVPSSRIVENEIYFPHHSFFDKSPAEIIDWMGLILCEVDIHNLPDGSSAYENWSFERNDCLQMSSKIITLSGFFDSLSICELIRELTATLKEEMIGIIVSGFEDSCVSWEGKRNEHGRKLDGANIYGLMLTHKKTLIWRCADEYDFGIERL